MLSMKTITFTTQELETFNDMATDAIDYRDPYGAQCRDCEIAQNDECDDHAEDRSRMRRYETLLAKMEAIREPLHD